MFFALAIPLALTLPSLVGGAATNTTRSLASHSLPDTYTFDARDGWDSVIVTNLRYKYRRSPTTSQEGAPQKNSTSVLQRPSSTSIKHSSIKNAFRSVGKSLAELTKSIVAVGKAQPVTITWYTGHDLLDPSCWANPKWSPTDESFVAAVTLDGWQQKPKCLKFIEVCSGTTNCIFARVVDTCAGCAKGTKHVDLTRAAFEKLAPLDQGVLTAQMRDATDPTEWDDDIWGPKDN